MEFLIIPRRPSAEVFEDDVRFDAHGRGRVLEEVRRKAEDRRIKVIRDEPVPGYWTKKESIHATEQTDGAKPVWIWWAE